MTDLRLEIVGLSKKYPPTSGFLNKLNYLLNSFGSNSSFVLQDLNIKAYAGETIGIVGFNGSGKSTLLKCIAGISDLTEGSIKRFGSVGGLIELGGGLNPDMNGLENIDLHLSLSGKSSKEVEILKEEIITFSELGQKLTEPVRTYSSGMLMRLSFSISVMHQYDIFIIDEALSVGDSRFQEKCIDQFFSMKKNGKLILLVTHDDYLIRQYCDRVWLLNKGALVFDGPSQEGVNKYLSLKQDYYQDKSLVDRDVLITDMKILNFQGFETATIGSDDVFSVILTVETNVERDVSVVLNFYSASGAYIHGCVSSIDLNRPFVLKKKMEIACKIENHRLLNGIVSVRAAINSGNGLAILNETFYPNALTVNSNSSAFGIINFERCWSVNETDH